MPTTPPPRTPMSEREQGLCDTIQEQRAHIDRLIEKMDRLRELLDDQIRMEEVMEEHLCSIIAAKDRTIHELRVNRATDMIRHAEVLHDMVGCVGAPHGASVGHHPNTQARATEVADASGDAIADDSADVIAQDNAEASGADVSAEASAHALTQATYNNFLVSTNTAPRPTSDRPPDTLVLPSGAHYVWDISVGRYGGWVPQPTHRRIT